MNKYEKALLRARKKVESGEERYICCALEGTKLAGEVRIRKYIGECLEGNITLTSWALENIREANNYWFFDDIFRLYRLRYIDEHLSPLVKTWE